jgi:hypothetical protein
MTERHIQLVLPEPVPFKADGKTYDPIKDFDRLANQMQWVVSIMADEEWRTLAQLSQATGGTEAAISARLRDLRKRQYGSQTIERRRVTGGLHEYRWVRRVDHE